MSTKLPLFESPLERALLAQYVERHNAGVRTGDFVAMASLFAEDASMIFLSVPVGPFVGRDGILAAFRASPPDDELVVDGAGITSVPTSCVTAPYCWARAPEKTAGKLILTMDRASGLIGTLLVR